jgi:hypothetical protein
MSIQARYNGGKKKFKIKYHNQCKLLGCGNWLQQGTLLVVDFIFTLLLESIPFLEGVWRNLGGEGGQKKSRL